MANTQKILMENVTKNLSLQWLKIGALIEKLKGMILTAQEQALETNTMKAKLKKFPVTANSNYTKPKMKLQTSDQCL